MNVCVLIPAFNEAKTISGIVKSLKAKGLDVIVIDDGSSDDTGIIASRAGAILLAHETNIGKGASLREGFDFILKNKYYDAVVTMDGDGQHRVEDVNIMIGNANSGDCDMIVGNRMGDTKKMPAVRFATNKFMSFLLSALCGQKIYDTQCGFRFIKRQVLESITLSSSNYDMESEILIEASKKKFRIKSVPVETIYMGEISKIHPVKDTLRFIKLIIKTLFNGGK